MDLMYKVARSKLLEVGIIIGIDPESKGLELARKEGFFATHNGIQVLIDHPGYADIVFDATTAKAHFEHAPILKMLKKVAIDLTPSGVGERVVPVINLNNHMDKDNVCLITCGGQAVIPIIKAVSLVSQVNYAEIIATIASKSAGPGTRKNIDEFTQSTRKGIIEIGGANEGKAINILNPAEPPIIMHNTIHCLVNELNKMDQSMIVESVRNMVNKVKKYVPGYEMIGDPIFYDDYIDSLPLRGFKITIMIKVTGAGDYLPYYAGNLDIMTSAAVATAEEFALKNT